MRNVDVREKIINSCRDKRDGWKKFYDMGERDEKYKNLRDVPCPIEYSWIFRHFMQIWQNCEHDMMGNVIFTFRTINEYVECMKVPLTVEDKKCLLKMKQWAMETIAEFKDKE